MRISDWSSDVCSSDLLPSFLKNSFSRACILPVAASSSASPSACTSCHSGGVISNHRSPASTSSRSYWTMRRKIGRAHVSTPVTNPHPVSHPPPHNNTPTPTPPHPPTPPPPTTPTTPPHTP